MGDGQKTGEDIVAVSGWVFIEKRLNSCWKSPKKKTGLSSDNMASLGGN